MPELGLLRELLSREIDGNHDKQAKILELEFEMAECKEALGDWRELFDDLHAAKILAAESHPNRRVEDPGYYYLWYGMNL